MDDDAELAQLSVLGGPLAAATASAGGSAPFSTHILSCGPIGFAQSMRDLPFRREFSTP